MTANRKNTLLIGILILVILACAAWIYYYEFGQAKYNVALHRRIGEVMAEQTLRLIGKKKGLVVIMAIETRDWPEIETQLDAFKASLGKGGDFQFKEYLFDTKDQPKYGIGSGLSGRRFVRSVSKNEEADVFVSFIGVPNLSEEDIAELVKPHKFIAETRSTDHLQKLFAKQLIQAAVVSRFQFPAPGRAKPKTVNDWFNKLYQVVTPETARYLPEPEPISN